MTFAQGSRSGVSYVVESTFGVTPGSPSMVDLPINSFSVQLQKEILNSDEIRSDRQTTVSRHGARQITGDMEVDFRADDYDDLLESACFGAFDSINELKVGTTPKFITLEERAEDISEYRIFTGCAVNTMSMSVASNQIVKATFNLIGKDMTTSQTPLDASITDSSTNDPFDGNNFIGSILENGSLISVVTSLEFTLSNNMAPTYVIGETATPFLEYGRAQIEGTLTAYFEDTTLIDKFINETASTLQFTLDDGVTGNAYTFLFPNIKYNGADVPIQNEQSRLITMPFIALKDATEGTNLVITKA